MKLKLFAVCIALNTIILTSCKKQDIKSTSLASLLVTNAVSGGGNLLLGTNAAPIYNNSYQVYGMLTGSKEINLVDTAGGINKVYFNQTKDLENGGLYSLFLGGIKGAVDEVFIKEENIPSHSGDVFGTRVINMVTGNALISINLAGRSNGSLIPGLAYKEISTFNDVSSQTAEGDKVFEFRNADTGSLITSFTVPAYDLPRFRNITLVISGNLNSVTAFRINNY